jgi:hypothetical protein
VNVESAVNLISRHVGGRPEDAGTKALDQSLDDHVRRNMFTLSVHRDCTTFSEAIDHGPRCFLRR